MDGRFIESADGNAFGESEYRFGTSQNVFSTYAAGAENPGLYDQTRNWRVIYDSCGSFGGPVGKSQYNTKPTVEFLVAEGVEQTRTCPITFRVVTHGETGRDVGPANWNCLGRWETDDWNQRFQAYAVSQ